MLLFLLLSNSFLCSFCIPKNHDEISRFFTSYIPNADYDETQIVPYKTDGTENTKKQNSLCREGKINLLPRLQTNNLSVGINEYINKSFVLSNSSNFVPRKLNSSIYKYFESAQNAKMYPFDLKTDPRSINILYSPSSSCANAVITGADHRQNIESRQTLTDLNVEDSAGNNKQLLVNGIKIESNPGPTKNIEIERINPIPYRLQVNQDNCKPSKRNDVLFERRKYDFTNATNKDIDEAINKFLDDYGLIQLNSVLRKIKPPSSINISDGSIIQPAVYIQKLPKQQVQNFRKDYTILKFPLQAIIDENSKIHLGDLFEECTLTQRLKEYEKANTVIKCPI